MLVSLLFPLSLCTGLCPSIHLVIHVCHPVSYCVHFGLYKVYNVWLVWWFFGPHLIPNKIWYCHVIIYIYLFYVYHVMLHNVTQCYITFSYTNKRGNAHYQLNNFVCLNEQNLRSLFYFHRFLKWKFIPAPCGDKLFFRNLSFHLQKPNFTAQLFTCHWSPSSYLLMCLLDPMSNPTHLVFRRLTF